VATTSTYEARLRDLLERVARGEVAAAGATRELHDLPFADLGFAKVDHHRELRQGHATSRRSWYRPFRWPGLAPAGATALLPR
jgi:hypothetical protein